MQSIEGLARSLDLPSEAWEPYGRWIAKLDPSAIPPPSARAKGRLVLVTGITPSGGGVGKTVSTIALGAALHRRGIRSMTCLRQPSMGPVFGIKGGGAGGGRATVEPSWEVNLGLTGDLNAVTNAHNLLASLIDNHLHHGNGLGIDAGSIVWPRALDLEDRPLRDIEIGAGKGNGPVRRASFVITPASEVTAILGLARDLGDLRARLGRMVVGRRTHGEPVTAQDLNAAGAMTALLRHAIKPNLLQSTEGSPVLVHGGPFGNLSYGTTTVASLELARRLADVVVVEAGFATELGAEKFVDLFAPVADLAPAAALLVASLPSLHAQSPGQSGPGSLAPGLDNLEKHLENVRALGLEPVVGLNRFPGDEPSEIGAVRQFCAARSVRLEVSEGFRSGGEGSDAVAGAVLEALSTPRTARPIYAPSEPILAKAETIVRRLYGGEGADLGPEAAAQLDSGELAGSASSPVCLAKTPLSLSDDPKKLGRPRGFRVTIRRFVRAAGADYTVALLGTINTMPGLPSDPRSARIDVDGSGAVVESS